MNSFEMDLKRAIFSLKFAAGAVLQLFILFQSGFDSEMFKISVPVVAAFPYSTAWLIEYQSGYLKSYLPRCKVFSYITGKFLACCISGGLVEVLSCFIYIYTKNQESEINLLLIFFSGMLWASVAAVLAAWSDSSYIAYGGGFVVYYILIILNERYFKDLYCLYPYEWLSKEHIWVFDAYGIVILLSGILLILFCIYFFILRRCLKNV